MLQHRNTTYGLHSEIQQNIAVLQHKVYHFLRFATL